MAFLVAREHVWSEQLAFPDDSSEGECEAHFEATKSLAKARKRRRGCRGGRRKQRRLAAREKEEPRQTQVPEDDASVDWGESEGEY